ncbi:MAG: inactive transglutaminase family protein [Pseudomonadota bacterium]
MERTGPFLFLVILLFLAGASAAIYRHGSYGMPYLPGTEQGVWEIEARIRYTATQPQTKVRLTLPTQQSGLRTIRESTASSGFGFYTESSKNADQTTANWSKSDAAGQQLLFYQLNLLEDPEYTVPVRPPGPLQQPTWVEPYRTAASEVLDTLRPQSADARSLAEQIRTALRTVPLDQNLALLLSNYNRPDRDAAAELAARAELIADLLNEAGYAAQEVQVLVLEDGIRRQTLSPHVRVWDGEQWLLLDPSARVVNDQAASVLWQPRDAGVLEVTGGSNSNLTFSVIRQVRSALDVAVEGQERAQFSLYSLPIAEQGMFKLIMLLPVGALVVVFMRLVVGLKTSGTFMPILLALAFLQTELVPGVISLLLVVMLGLMLRTYLSALNLLLVARIATLVILVIGIITVVSIISYEMGLISGLTISFFPMIILAWTIERMAILWEEEGPREVLVQGSGSLLVAILAFTLMDTPSIKHLAFNFPELHLCVLAIVLLLGRYTGYRLSELIRFAPFYNVPEIDELEQLR